MHTDLDAQRPPIEERTFTIHGETFHYHTTVHPKWVLLTDEIDGSIPGDEVFRRIDGMVNAMLSTDDDKRRWAILRDREDDPLNLADLILVRNFLVQEQSGRPPTPLPGSSNGQARTGTNSTAPNFSEPDAASKT